ncbi:MAG: hypothetical protein AMXMBFR13_11960 [Phycisphaerae bacterium]|jgi:multidrug transporter EmrE-like cation transporter
MKYWIALALALTLNATANLMMKFGMVRFKAGGGGSQQGLGALVGQLAQNWVLLLGLVCFAVNVAFYTFALKEIKISVAYPIMVSLGFAIIAVVAWRFLGETLSPLQWTGIALILAGVYLVAREVGPVA